MLDSLNVARANDRGAFNLYIKKPEVEVIAGLYRNRTSVWQGFDPVTFTYNISLPFQYDLNYVNLKAKDKLMKLNVNFVFHHSKFGNYAAGGALRISFLVAHKTYVSYQGGVVWCEVVKRNTNDGINYMGFNMNHQFSVNYNLTSHIKFSANIIHTSGGKLFNGIDNLQDVLGFGAAYQF